MSQGQGPRPADRLAVALVAYGVSGLILIFAMAATVSVAFGTLEEAGRALGGDQGLIARLAAADKVLADASQANVRLDTTIGATADAATSGEQMTRRLAATMRATSDALQVSILGSQPFAGVSDQFRSVGSDSDALADRLHATASALADDRVTLASLSTELSDLAGQMKAIRDGLDSAVATEGGPLALLALTRLVILALFAWLAIPAAVALFVGARRLRRRATATP